MRHGFTLLELIAALLIAAMTLSMILPAARRAVDRSAVVGARESIVGLVSRARAEARVGGGATLCLRARPAAAWIEVGAGRHEIVDLATEFGIDLRLSRNRDQVRLPFDALGIGRIASQTVTLTRGEATAGVVVSGYGRVIRR
jgi:prepilin-type N-terminal cleavage/methylation domain-containing protein